MLTKDLIKIRNRSWLIYCRTSFRTTAEWMKKKIFSLEQNQEKFKNKHSGYNSEAMQIFNFISNELKHRYETILYFLYNKMQCDANRWEQLANFHFSRGCKFLSQFWKLLLARIRVKQKLLFIKNLFKPLMHIVVGKWKVLNCSDRIASHCTNTILIILSILTVDLLSFLY